MSETWIFPLKCVWCCQLWSGCKTPGQKERSSRKKQELAGDTLHYSRKQQGVTTVTRMMTDRLDLRFNHRQVFEKVQPQASSQNHISNSLRQSRVKESNGYLDFVPVGEDLNESMCFCVLYSPAHNLMCEQNSAHFWILVLALIRNGLRGGNEEQWWRIQFHVEIN